MATIVPSTPTPQRVYRWPHFNDAANKPTCSSPLVSPTSPTSSPVSAAQARRRTQYKSRTPSTPLPSSSRNRSTVRSSSHSGGSVFGSGGSSDGQRSLSPVTEDPRRNLIRERFRAQCFKRAMEAREKAVRGKRYAYSPGGSINGDGSDDTVMEEDDFEDEDIMQDELFRRIMNNAYRKSQYAYRVSFALDVGSSIDPDMEDISAWEKELHDSDNPHEFPEALANDLTEEEIAAYAEEQAALADFQDIDIDELLGYDEPEEDLARPSSHSTEGMDVDPGS